MNQYAEELVNKGVRYALFDIDNTITKSNILNLYLYIKSRRIKSKALYKMWFADSKYDLPVLEYAKYSKIISNKKEKWTSTLNNPRFITI